MKTMHQKQSGILVKRCEEWRSIKIDPARVVYKLVLWSKPIGAGTTEGEIRWTIVEQPPKIIIP